MSEIQIAFDIFNATCHQIVRVIDHNYDEDKIIEGLEDGSLVTTTWFDPTQGQSIDQTKNGYIVAEIISQEIHGEYEDFR